jgi:hypothetical protein
MRLGCFRRSELKGIEAVAKWFPTTFLHWRMKLPARSSSKQRRFDRVAPRHAAILAFIGRLSGLWVRAANLNEQQILLMT